MRAMLKRVLGWDQRTEAEKAAFRECRYHPLRALGVYLGSHVISLFPIPLRFKRTCATLCGKGRRTRLRGELGCHAGRQARSNTLSERAGGL